MANIRIAKPQGKTQIQADTGAGARYVFEFPVSGAEFSRSGQDLAIRLDDGATVEIKGFYTAKGKKPSFVMEDREIDAKEFFESMGKPDLVPAAGPGQSQSSSAAGRGRFHDYDTAEAMGGIEHLGGLDDGSGGADTLVRSDAMGLVRNGLDDLFADEENHFDMGGFSLEVIEGDSRVQSGRIPIGFQNPVSIVVNGQAIAVAGATEIEFAGGVLTLTPNNGWIDYTYENKGPIRHENGEDAHFPLEITATGSDGKTSSVTLDVVVRDDSPEIRGSFEYELDELSPDGLRGNVLEGSRPSADGPNVLTFEDDAKYGEFTYDPDTGEWSYKINPQNPYIKNLDDGETLTEEIHYKYTDSDGSVAEGVIVITINGQPDAIRLTAVDPSGENDYGSGVMIVRESALDEGSAPGAARTATGAIGVDALVDIESISVAGHDVPVGGSASFDIDGGVLTVRHEEGLLRYEYQLKAPFTAGGDGVDLALPVVIQGANGFAAEGDIRIHVADDEPVLESNIRFNIFEDNFDSISGNALEGSHPGADGAVFLWVDTAAKHGSFRDLGDGLWDYVLDPDFGGQLPKGQSFTETFAYSYRDADGNEKIGKLTITITGKDDGVSFTRGHGGEGDDPLNLGEDADGVMTVHEAGLPEGTQPGLINKTAHGEAEIKAPDGIEYIRVGDADVPLDGTPASVELPHGTLIVSWDSDRETLDWIYTLETPADNTEGDVFDETEIFVKNIGGEGGTLPIKVKITDDKPADIDIRVEAGEDSGEIAGNVSETGKVGADGVGNAELVDDPVWTLPDGRELGYLEVEPDGSYRFVPGKDIETLLKDEEISHEWTVKVSDRDGDETEGRITVNLTGKDSGVDIKGDLSFPIEENKPGSTDIEITSPDGIDKIIIGGEELDPKDPESRAEVDVPGGKITATYEDGKLHLEFEPDGPYDHGDGDSVEVKIPVVIINGSGGKTETEIEFDLVDGKPSITEPKAEDVSPDKPVVEGKLSIDPGADDGGHLEWPETDTPYGKLIPDPEEEGKWRFELDPDSPEVKRLGEDDTIEVKIPFKYIDGDGDTAEGELTIRVTGKDDGVEFSSSSTLGDVTGMAVSEKGLAHGNGDGSLSSSGFLLMDAPDGVRGVTVDGVSLEPGKTANIGIDGGTLSITLTDTGLAYSFVLTEASASQGHDFKIEVDTGGKETHSHTLRLSIEDDGPVIDRIDSAEVMSDTTRVVGGNVLQYGHAGADGPGEFSWDLGVGVHELDYGTLELFADGSWKFAADPEKGADLPKNQIASQSIGFTWKDADGTPLHESLEVSVKGAGKGIRLGSLDGDGNETDPVMSGSEAEWYDSGSSGSSGQIRIEHEDGDLKSITVNGVDIPLTGGGKEIPVGDYGVIKAGLDGDILKWEFELTGNVDKNAPHDPIVITVTDATGTSQSIEYDILIDDDGPAKPADAFGEIIETETGSATGRIDFDFRADGPDGKDPVRIVDGPKDARGTLTINPDGTWTYTFRDGDHYVGPEGAEEKFVYELKDADGDTVRGEIVIRIKDDDGSGAGGAQGFDPFAGDADGGRFALADANVGQTIVKTITLPADRHHEAFVDVKIDGSAVSELGADLDWRVSKDGHTLTGSQGGVDKVELVAGQAGGNWTLTAVMLAPVSHDELSDLANLSNIPIVAVDAHGTEIRSDPAALRVTALDSRPSANDVEVPVIEGETGAVSGDLAKGSADAPNRVTVGDLPEGWRLVGTELYHGEEHAGKLVIQPDGKYAFTLDPGFDITDDLGALRIPVRVEDADGDSEDIHLVLNWEADHNRPVATRPKDPDNDPEDPDNPNPGGDDGDLVEIADGDNIKIRVSEASLEKGSAPDESALVKSGTMNLGLGGEDGGIMIAGKSVDIADGRIVGKNGPVDEAKLTVTLAGGEGELVVTLSMNDDGTVRMDYEFTLKGAMNHADGRHYEPIPVVITDATHDKLSFGLQIDIVDDEPMLIRTEPVQLYETNAFEPFDIAEWVAWGADGIGTIESAEGRYGHLEQTEDGKWRYVLKDEYLLDGVANIPEGGMTDWIEIVGTDGDGSPISMEKLAIHINDVAPEIGGLSGADGLTVKLDERDRISDTSPEAVRPTGSPHPVVSVVIDSADVNIEGMDMTGVDKKIVDGRLIITAGNGTVITIEVVPDDGWRLKASFEGPLPHAGDDDIVISGISLRVEDASGSTKIIDGGSIEIADSAPVTNGDTKSYTEGKDEPVTGRLHDDFGPDNSKTGYQLDAEQNGEGKYGKLTLDENGNYTYIFTAGPNVVPEDGDADIIKYWAVDADGSRTQGEIVINIQTNGPKVVDGVKLEVTLNEADSVLDSKDGVHRASISNNAKLFVFEEDTGAEIAAVEFSDKYGAPELAGFSFALSDDRTMWTGTGANGSKIILVVRNVDNQGEVSVDVVLEGNVPHGSDDLARVGNVSIKAIDSTGRSTTVSGVISADIRDVNPVETGKADYAAQTDIDALIATDQFIDELTLGDDGKYAPGEKSWNLHDFVDMGVDANGAKFSIGGDTFEGKYGTFHLEAGGKLVYVRNDEHVGEDVLEDPVTIRYRDADNDEGSFTFNLAVKNTPPVGVGTIMGEMQDAWTRGNGLVDENGADMKNQYIYIGTLDHLKDNVDSAVERNGQLYYEETDATGNTTLVAMQTTENIFTQTWLNNYSTTKGSLRFSLPDGNESGERFAVHTNYEGKGGEYEAYDLSNKTWLLSRDGQTLSLGSEQSGEIQLKIVNCYDDGSIVIKVIQRSPLHHVNDEPILFEQIGFEWVDKDGTTVKVGDCSVKIIDDNYPLQDGLIFSAVQGKTIGSGTNENEAYFLTVSLPDDQYSADANAGTSTWQLYDNASNPVTRLDGEYGYFTIRESGINTKGLIYYRFYDNAPVPDGAVERFNYGVTDPDGSKSNVVYGVLKVFGNKVVGAEHGFVIDEMSSDVVSPTKVQVFNPDTLVRDEENGRLVVDRIPDGKGGYIEVSSHWSDAPDIDPASVRFASGTNNVVGEHFFSKDSPVGSTVSPDGRTLTITDKNTGGQIIIVINKAYADGTVDFGITTKGIMATGYDYEHDHSYKNVILSNIKLEANLGTGKDAIEVVNSNVSLTVNDDLHGYQHFDDTVGLTSNTSRFGGVPTSSYAQTGLIEGDLTNRLDTHNFTQQFRIIERIGDDARAELLLDESGAWKLANHLTMNDSSDKFGVETWIIKGTGMHVDMNFTYMNGSGEISEKGYHDFYVDKNGAGIGDTITSASSDRVDFNVSSLSDGWSLEGNSLSYKGELVGELILNPSATKEFQLVFDKAFDFSHQLGDLSIAYTITRDSGKGDVTECSLDFHFEHQDFIYKFEANIDSGNRYADKLAENMPAAIDTLSDDAPVDDADSQDMLEEPAETLDDLIGSAGESQAQPASVPDPVFSEMLGSEQDAAETAARELANGNH